jgi:hypothetical protein
MQLICPNKNVGKNEMLWAEQLCPVAQNGSVFGGRGFKEGTKLKGGH